MTAGSEQQAGPAPLTDNVHFQNLAAYTKLRNEISQVFHVTASETQKLSTEFSKLIIINLQFINASGLFAVPTLATNLLGLSGLDRSEKLIYLGLPMLAFASGLICASLCAFFTYRNYQAISSNWLSSAALARLEVDKYISDIPAETVLLNEKARAEVNLEHNKSQKTIQRNYISGLAAGWSSMIFFITACALLGYFVR